LSSLWYVPACMWKQQRLIISSTCHSISNLKSNWLYLSYSYPLITFWEFPFFPFTIIKGLTSLCYVPAFKQKKLWWVISLTGHSFSHLKRVNLECLSYSLFLHSYHILNIKYIFKFFIRKVWASLCYMYACKLKKEVLSYFINLQFHQLLKKTFFDTSLILTLS
jgi:hypothetical protein